MQIEIGNSSIHVVSAGDPGAAAYVFVHGWPESSLAWQGVMALAAPEAHVVALDLPGIGGSTGDPTDGSKQALAEVVHGVIAALGLRDVTLVGHDCGGMVTYAYLRAYDDLRGAVIMDTVVPGVDPWDEVLRNPYIWHFALHAVPGLPELLVQGRQRAYFDYFYDVLSPSPEAVSVAARDEYAAAYATDDALRAGFSWYRAFPRDAKDARAAQAAQAKEITTPLLYLRGEHESGEIGDYVEGFGKAGVRDLRSGVIPGAGHFAPDQAPADTWRLITAEFAPRGAG
jgi:pimeloyl-ACP methyl ester carboxylesterase